MRNGTNVPHQLSVLESTTKSPTTKPKTTSVLKKIMKAIAPTSWQQRSAVWLTAQRSRVAQRGKERYHKDSFAHPGKMLPDLTRSILMTYGAPGQTWCDPMCGIGTLLIEASDLRLGLQTYGVEWESRWVSLAQENVGRAITRNTDEPAPLLLQGDARELTQLFQGVTFDRIAFSPPYGNTLSKTAHGPDLRPEKQKGGKRGARALRHGYTFTGNEHLPVPDAPGQMSLPMTKAVNLGDLRHGDLDEALTVARALATGTEEDQVQPSYLSEMAKVYNQCYLALNPGGLMILVLKDYRRENRRIDLLGDTIRLCTTLGFRYHDRISALQCPIIVEGTLSTGKNPKFDFGNIWPRPEGATSFWVLENVKKSQLPLMAPVFEDVIVFVREADRGINQEALN